MSRENDLLDMMSRANQAKQDDLELRQEKLLKASRERLGKILETKIKTTFISALSAIEKELGQLWGNKRKIEDMSPDEVFYWDKFQKLRNLILNNGNNQIRAMHAELALHDVTWVGYEYEMVQKEGKQ